MLDLVTSGLTTVISWVGTVSTSIVSETGQLHDMGQLFAIGIACSAFFLGIKGIKSVTWGA